MNRSPKKLWKQVGITKQKFDRSNQRSRSFDRESITKSKDNKSVSSHQGSNKLAQFKSKVEYKAKTQLALNIFVSQINHHNNNCNQLKLNLIQVPQEQDIQSMKNSRISIKNQNRYIDNINDLSQLQLLNQIFDKKCKENLYNNKKIKIDNGKIINLFQKLRQLQIQHSQTEKIIKHQFDVFRIQKRKNDRVLKQIMKRMTDNIYSRQEQIDKLNKQNDQLKKELFKAYDMIEQLQRQKQTETGINKNSKRFNPSHTQKFFKDEDDRTVKIRDKKKELELEIQKIKNKTNSYYDHKYQTQKYHRQYQYLNYSKNIYARNPDNNMNFQYQQQTPKDSRPQTAYYGQIGLPEKNSEYFIKDFDTLSNRQKFKKYLHQRKKKDLLYQKSENGIMNIQNKTQDGMKVIKYKKQNGIGFNQIITSTPPTKEVIHNAFSLNINSLTEKYAKKGPMANKKNDHKDCNSNTRIQRLKSESFLKFNQALH